MWVPVAPAEHCGSGRSICGRLALVRTELLTLVFFFSAAVEAATVVPGTARQVPRIVKALSSPLGQGGFACNADLLASDLGECLGKQLSSLIEGWASPAGSRAGQSFHGLDEVDSSGWADGGGQSLEIQPSPIPRKRS